MKTKKTLTYKSTGVNYDVMDPLKRMAQREGRKTAMNFFGTGFAEVHQSRGESAYVIEHDKHYFAFVEEGLGTKNLVADVMFPITGKTYYEKIAHDTVATMVNDLITVGAKPLTILAYWAVGNDAWFRNTKRLEDLVIGWREACDLAGAVWGGGETPSLGDIIEHDAIDLAGACFGVIDPKDRLTLGDTLQAGDAIVFFESNGIHANGLSLARKIGKKLQKGYKTTIGDGRMYGEALLDPTTIYTRVIQDLFEEKITIHYMANITGHGWRKIMRYTRPFTYQIKEIPPVPQVLQFIVENGPVEEKEAYANFNMGAGFAIFVSNNDVENIIKIAEKHKIKAYLAGVVEEGKKQVIIEPKQIVFEGKSLQVRE